MSGCTARYTDRAHGGGSVPDVTVCDEPLKWVSVCADECLQLGKDTGGFRLKEHYKQPTAKQHFFS